MAFCMAMLSSAVPLGESVAKIGQFALGTPPGIPAWVQSMVRDAGKAGAARPLVATRMTVNPARTGSSRMTRPRIAPVLRIRLPVRNSSPHLLESVFILRRRIALVMPKSRRCRPCHAPTVDRASSHSRLHRLVGGALVTSPPREKAPSVATGCGTLRVRPQPVSLLAHLIKGLLEANKAPCPVPARLRRLQLSPGIYSSQMPLGSCRECSVIFLGVSSRTRACSSLWEMAALRFGRSSPSATPVHPCQARAEISHGARSDTRMRPRRCRPAMAGIVLRTANRDPEWSL